MTWLRYHIYSLSSLQYITQNHIYKASDKGPWGYYQVNIGSTVYNQVIVYKCQNFLKVVVHLGPVVQRVVSLTSSLRVISLTILAYSIYNILIFFAEKM